MVIPIFKKGSRTQPTNYRPVSLTSIACKMLESIIKDSLVHYFTVNNLFLSISMASEQDSHVLHN